MVRKWFANGAIGAIGDKAVEAAPAETMGNESMK